jgi:hypothetical protein
MPLENFIDHDVAIEHGIEFNPETAWGGKKSDWINWKTAEKNLDFMGYINKQAEVALGPETRAAFNDKIGDLGLDPNDVKMKDLLGQFFVDNMGAIYFKRLNFQHRKDLSQEVIASYYKDREWEKEIEEHRFKNK